nr:TaqI-like C-terminal specificity domain-containing protein [Ferrimicrobium acidiphilum]
MCAAGPPPSNFDLEAAKSEVQRLVAEYERAKTAGSLSQFTEEDTKKNFILPLFRALGWNVDSSDVSAEERVHRRRVDYAFRIDRAIRFIVEAKAISKNLAEREYLQQAIDYSYQKRVTWAVLTNFARTFVLYSELRSNNPFDCRFFELPAEEYVPKFDLLRLLSRPAIASGELDLKAEEFGRKPRKQPIDKQLLQDLNRFRLDLAKEIRRLNDSKFRDADEALEETVQRLLDRLIFIRVAEDRFLEDRQLSQIAGGPESKALGRLRELFRRYDDNFDTKLFLPHAVDSVRIGGEVLQRVLRGLHETAGESVRYNFDVIDADILGVMYEQYLGLVLKQTAKRAKLADGAVNRKEQGIYYTPTWVVDYIVRFSIEEALKRKGARPERLRVLDPACGSGTFLLRAYDHLMRARNPTGASVQSRFDPETSERLVGLRTSVLTENLFGVDLDPRAVEIAQLNLMIRAAESRHRLPTLERNVRVGNSVIADPSLDPRALDWAKAFPLAMEEGGFDVIVGNPPYLNVKRGFFKELQPYIESRYETAVGQYDFYRLFVELAVRLLKDGGVLGMIIPRRALVNENELALRRFLLSNGRLLRIAEAGAAFEEVAVEAAIVIFQKTRARPTYEVPRDIASVQGAFSPRESLRISETAQDPNLTIDLVADRASRRVRRLIERDSMPLSEFCSITRGVEAGKDSSYISETETDYPLLFGEEVSRYIIKWRPKWIRFSKDEPSTFKPEPLYRQHAKLLIRRVADDLITSIDYDMRVVLNTLYIVSINKKCIPPEYLCALLNSKVIRFWFKTKFVLTEKLFPYIRKSQLDQIPIKVSQVDTVCEISRKLLGVGERLSKLPAARTDEVDRLRAEVRAAIVQLDSVVYAIYQVDPQSRETIEQSLVEPDTA